MTVPSLTVLPPNTQAILLLTAPLTVARGTPQVKPLSLGEYKRLARVLRQAGKQPADLLDGYEASQLAAADLEHSRVESLLGRGFQLSQAVEKWQARAIWVLSRADMAYPPRFRKRLGEDAPPVLYGCGDPAALDGGGLAVVGSRKVDEALLRWTEDVGRFAAQAGCPVVSGGARGVDQAAMGGALGAKGRAVGVLSDTLERAVVNRDYRDAIQRGSLVLVSPYDPGAAFHVGNAMQRNKLIYALSDAALVVNSDLGKGGTWEGAVEQLEKRHLVPVFVRQEGQVSEGLVALARKGARPWPGPRTAEDLLDLLRTPREPEREQGSLFVGEEPKEYRAESAPAEPLPVLQEPAPTPAEELFSKVRELCLRLERPASKSDVATMLGVKEPQAHEWLARLVEAGVLEQLERPVRYQVAGRALDWKDGCAHLGSRSVTRALTNPPTMEPRR